MLPAGLKPDVGQIIPQRAECLRPGEERVDDLLHLQRVRSHPCRGKEEFTASRVANSGIVSADDLDEHRQLVTLQERTTFGGKETEASELIKGRRR
ncbi:hypothetical protein GCM10023192_69570 [Amycolatopsis samaneae]